MRTESTKNIIEFEPVKPINPIAPYLGGKRILAKTIVPIIAQIPHNIYCEPFMGMGGVFFRRAKRPKCEAINDINSEIVNMFRMVEKFPNYLADMLKFKICSRAEFKRMLATPPLLLTELERAVRYLYIQKNAFGGKAQHQAFGVATERAGRFNAERLIPQIKELHQRLTGVYIECLPYQKFITRYDRSETLFYLDPPYWNCEDDYGKGIFSKADFENLAKLLKSIKGKFVMSINDVSEIRHIFMAFHIKEVSTNYSLGQGSGNHQTKHTTELLISNVKLDTL
ncbi:MAG: DNA adenine methylase [Proteobacteria bacterium]|nr:DNA adenine methylase [Pseudomonadota bacterium]